MPIGKIQYHNSASDEWTDTPPIDPNEEGGQRYIGGPNDSAEFFYSDVPGSSWTPVRLDAARQYIQENVLDLRIDRATLPAEHPYIKDGDPGLEWVFWDGTDVVERLVVADDLYLITVDTVDLPRITLRRVSRRMAP